jgi:hypothetical protein
MIKTGANAQDERVRPFSIQQQQHSWKEAQGTAACWFINEERGESREDQTKLKLR